MKVFDSILKIESQIKSDPYNPVHHIALARAFLEEGNEEQARRIIVTKRKLPSKDPAIHFEWGRLCEELGMSHQARESYEQAISLDPESPEYHFRLGLLYYEKGAWEKVIKHFHKTISLSENYPEVKKVLSSIYEEMGHYGIASAISNTKIEKEESVSVPKTFELILKERELSLFLNLFQGREFGFAKYTISPEGDITHIYVDKGLIFSEILKHLHGEHTIGVYPLRSDKTLKFCAINIKIPRRRLLANIKNTGFLSISENHIHQYALEIRERVKERGIFTYLEKPGDRERRLWFFFEEFIPFEFAERFLNSIFDYVQSPSLDISINFLIGFREAGIGFEDHPVMLPLGINPRTGKRCLFIDNDGNSYEDQIAFLKKVRRIRQDEIRAFLKGSKPVELSSTTIEAIKDLQRRCPVVNDIILKAQSGRSLIDEEKKTIFFTIGFLPDGKRLIHNILEPCPDYRPNRVEKILKKIKGSPISCPKIRRLMPERTAYLSCNCLFEIPAEGYPSPLIHVDPDLVKRSDTFLNKSKVEKENASLDELRRQYIFVCRKIEQLEKEKKILNEKIRSIVG